MTEKMGSTFSEFYTYDEAARRLAKTRRSIHNYVKRGLLRASHIDGRVVLHREDVEQLAHDQGVGQRALNRKNFYLLLGEVRELQAKVELLSRMAGVSFDPLRPTVEESKGLSAHLGFFLSRDAWSYQEMEHWASIYERIDETTLDLLAAHTGQEEPWETFYRLLQGQLKYLVAQGEGSVSVSALQNRMEKARERLRAVAVIWTEMNRGRTSAVHQKVNTGKDDLLARLAMKRSKSG